MNPVNDFIKCLNTQLLHIKLHLKIWNIYSETINTSKRICNVAPIFTIISFNSIQYCLLLRVSNLIEKRKNCDSITILNLINIMQKQSVLFKNSTELGFTIDDFCNSFKNELYSRDGSYFIYYNKIITWRDKLIAHNDPKYYYDPIRIIEEYSIHNIEIDSIINYIESKLIEISKMLIDEVTLNNKLVYNENEIPLLFGSNE